MFVPIILGSDKTTVSVATGQNEYWPVYLSIGNIRNNVRRAHRNGVVYWASSRYQKVSHHLCPVNHTIPIPLKAADKKHAQDAKFRHFRRQLFHSSLAKILESLKPGMTTPEVVRCPDGRFRRAIYGLGPYIADYPEQALLACIVQGWCAKYVEPRVSLFINYMLIPRCTAKASDIDGDGATYRTQAHSEAVAEAYELGELWDQYGLVGDVIVSRYLILMFSIATN